MKDLKKWFKSWTMNYSVLLAIAGAVQTNLEFLQLTQKQMGLAMILLAGVTAVLRAKTEVQPSLDKR